MKKKIVTAALAATVALTGVASASAASAQSWDRDGNRAERRYEQKLDRKEERREDRREARAERREDRAEARADRRAARRYNAGRYQPPSGYVHRAWRRGERLPYGYRGRAYVVDHRHYGLMAPPYGYHYVRVDNDVFLTAVATGLIASIVFGLFQ